MNDDTAHLEKRGELDDEANTADARKLLDLMVGHRADTLSDAGGTIDLFELPDADDRGYGRAYVRVPVGTPVHTRRTLGMYGVEDVEFRSIVSPTDLDDVPLSVCVSLETEGARYTFVFDMVVPSEAGDGRIEENR